MHISFFSSLLHVLLLLHLTWAPISSTAANRRVLHEPFFPEESSPPSSPPTATPATPSPPSTPKYPFSSSTTPTPENSPFFPNYPAPPPPPSPASYASFPANISSLILPGSSKPKPSTRKLLPVAIAVALSALVLLAAALVVLRRRRRSRDSADDAKTQRSDATNGGLPGNAEATARPLKQRTTSGASSEFLYLGTMVNSRGIEEPHGNGGGGLDPRKMDSPELQPLPPLARQSLALNCGNMNGEARPLPPLARQSLRQNCKNGNGDVSSTADETEEEFYSPRASLGGRESSIGAGSGSRRAFAAVASETLGGSGRRSDSSSSSYSSSSSGSPARSHSISLSPPVSLSPRRSQPKSPEHVAVEEEEEVESQETSSLPTHYATPYVDESKTPLLSSETSSPERSLGKSDAKVQSPSLSPMSWSPERG